MFQLPTALDRSCRAPEQTATGIRDQLKVFGNDYPTPDGTAVRDYIHVVDLARAHVMALNRLVRHQNSDRFEVFNLGTGKGSSVLEAIRAFEQATGESLNWTFAPRRPGDVIQAYADSYQHLPRGENS